MSDLKTNPKGLQTTPQGFNIDPKYKPVEEIQNHRIGISEMTYADALHYAYLEVEKGNLDEEVKKQVIAHLSMIFLRGII